MSAVGAVAGGVAPGFEAVGDAFAEALSNQPGTGAATAVWHDGTYVVDLWGGYADSARTTPWQRDSIAMPYSVSKPFAAVCALLLVERGQLGLDDLVADHWPGFVAPATVRQVLSHQAGVVALDGPLPTEAFADWDLICDRLAAQPPAWTPGTAHGESALFYGHLVGELVHRVDGRPLGRFLHEDVTGPLELDFGFGLSQQASARAVDLTGFDERFLASQAADRPELFLRAVGNPPGAFDTEVVNSPWWRAAEVPAVNGHGTARAVAGFYAALSSERLLRPHTLAEATSVATAGTDRVFGFQNAWGLGFAVDDDGFGMGGTGGSLGWWSRAGGYAFAFVTASAGAHDRSDLVENAVRDCIGLDPL
jgi:CubicO group peptidase (beta-lactamase class C family)